MNIRLLANLSLHITFRYAGNGWLFHNRRRTFRLWQGVSLSSQHAARGGGTPKRFRKHCLWGCRFSIQADLKCVTLPYIATFL